jgi:hypothetical protein
MRLSLAVLSILIMTFSARFCRAQETGQPVVFEELGPIQDADPEVRQLRTLNVPMMIIAESEGDDTYISFDERSACDLRIEIGYKMAVGCEWILYYYRGAEKVVLRHGTGSSLESMRSDSRHVVRGLQEIADLQGSLQLIADLSVFETDIPPQHMWMPGEGKYRLLWKGVATGMPAGN